MAKREIQEINAGSMADIAFLLLIFFLVTTTMDTDSGIVRKLPPIPEEQQEDIQIKERNIFVVLVNRDNQLLVEGNSMDIKDLREATKEFIMNPLNDPELPALEPVEVDYFGTVNITKKHVISLRNDRGTSFKTYITVQNELAAAINELRNELSMQRFGKKFEDLDPTDDKDKRKAIETIVPMKVSEAEPNTIGG